MRWVQLCSSLSILWHCLSLGLEWKLTFSSPVATAEFSKFSGILNAALSQHHFSGFKIALWRPTRPFRINIQKRCPFHYRGLECKSRKSRNTWSNRQIWLLNMEWSKAKVNRVLPREHINHSKHPLPTTQERTTHGHHQMVNTKSDWLYSLQPKMEKLYTVSKNKTRSWLWLRSWTPYCQIQT